MNAATKILILDDHAMIRKGIRLTIETTFGVQHIEEAASCASVLKCLKQEKFSHLLLDLLVSDGNTLEIIPTIKNLYPWLRILIFTMQPPEVYAPVLRQYGINEYLHKEVNEEVTIAILQKFLTGKADDERVNDYSSVTPFSKLTAREFEILHYILKGVGTKQISDLLNLQMSTVSTMKYRIFEKTKTNNIKELIDTAVVYNICS